MGDVSFGGVSYPQFLYSRGAHCQISFDVQDDLILEHTEEGELVISLNPGNFDGHTPMFKSVRIIIKDNEGKFHTLTIQYTFVVVDIQSIPIILPAVALVTLNVPPVIHESTLEFTATVLLVRPEILISQASLEINLEDTEITALNPG